MDARINVLREQVAAARFLLNSLQSQLHEAENEAAARRIQSNNIQQTNRNQIATTQELTGSALTNQHDGNPAVARSLHDHTEYVGPSLEDQSNILDQGNLTFINDDEENDALGETILTQTSTFDLPSLEIGHIYPSLESVKAAARAHAVTQGWTCGVQKRDKTRILLKCRSDISCPFFVRAEVCENGARIVSYRPKHSCTFQIDQSHIPRGHAASLEYMRDQLPTFMEVTAETSAKEIGDAIFERFGTRVSVKQCQKLRSGPKRKRKPTMATCGRCGGVGHNVKTCGRTME